MRQPRMMTNNKNYVHITRLVIFSEKAIKEHSYHVNIQPKCNGHYVCRAPLQKRTAITRKNKCESICMVTICAVLSCVRVNISVRRPPRQCNDSERDAFELRSAQELGFRSVQKSRQGIRKTNADS